MGYWFRGKRGGLIAFILIATLVAGGLGWMTAAVLRLEREQLEAQVRGAQDEQLRVEMWKLEARVAPALAMEDNRPFNHYSPIFATSRAFVCNDGKWDQDTVLEPSPLLSSDLPDWILLHFQTDNAGNWSSPEVVSQRLGARFDKSGLMASCTNVTPARAALLQELRAHLRPAELLAELGEVERRGNQALLVDSTLELANFNPNLALDNNAINQGQQPAQQMARGQAKSYQERANLSSKVQNDASKNSAQMENRTVAGNNFVNPEAWFARGQLGPLVGDNISVTRGRLLRTWVHTSDDKERLIAARLVHVGEREVCQGMVLDWDQLQKVLKDEVAESLPNARFEPMREPPPPHPERTMINLPIEVEPGFEMIALTDPGWTPLRVGLALAWAAALVALLAVGLGSWGLLDLSERRIRFVSAVTHELRTPLTTLRLYLDMLTGGLVREEQQKDEYLHTLHAEADRLHRLIANVLDYSRLEDQRPRLAKSTVRLGALLEQVRATWHSRCQDAGKELIIENMAGDVPLETDPELTQQILGNLIDNACKYSRTAEDRRIWLRANRLNGTRLLLEVEDRGPGVQPRERHAIFRAFRRGRGTDATGGVGLGLALAQRWAKLLGGQLSLRGCSSTQGACFQLELPISSLSV
jgi:signal transduction histidine kinase